MRELETKVNTDYLTIRNHCEELKFLRIFPKYYIFYFIPAVAH